MRAAFAMPSIEGHDLRVLAPEGLIITKMVALRPQDQEDIRTLLTANRETIDVELVRREWAAVSAGEDDRTRWLEKVLQTG